MIVVKKRYNFDEWDPVLVFTGDDIWGLKEMYEAHKDDVERMNEEEFASMFDGPNLLAFRAEEDPFKDLPNAEEIVYGGPYGDSQIGR